ncbi:hypothetical protein B0H66DRAFT_40658 [Apodospora peruviana]|uniref:G-protein coupled receptors family 2 profile 2 domain-containing protein n=1 Tax=Apodospora peruviana TaxID=516989 RepID=A0AAE0MES3_9PEZI|nr:hypothetical protein B0H66DRAFT_40658 [Apodospora peruviana]
MKNILNIQPGVSGYMNLTDSQRDTIQKVERVNASFSLVGVFLIFITYALFKRLRTVPNTFILFASIANVGASIACIIGYAGIAAGDHSALCRTQAFLLELFMQSDPWWSFAMAANVYMVFFLAANPILFRDYLWAYCLVCFGLPAIPAFICLFYSPNNAQIYGNATLWCWIGDSFNSLRIFSYYLPIWACILLSGVIYVAVGFHVFHQRNQLRNLTLSTQAKDAGSGSDIRESAEKSLAGQPGSYGTVTTEVQVTAECSDSQTPPPTPAPSIAPVLPTAAAGTSTSQSSGAHMHGPCPWTSHSEEVLAISPTSATGATSLPFTTISSISSAKARNKEKEKRMFCGVFRRPFRKFRYKLRNLDPVKLAYLRTSFVFAVSVLVTWTPSSINRVHAVIYPTRTSYALNLASAIVLPLQGVWNAVIYCATTWSVLIEELQDFRDSWLPGGAKRRASKAALSAAARERERELRQHQAHHHFGGTRFRPPGGGVIDDADEPILMMGSGGHRLSTMRVIRGGSL